MNLSHIHVPRNLVEITALKNVNAPSKNVLIPLIAIYLRQQYALMVLDTNDSTVYLFPIHRNCL